MLGSYGRDAYAALRRVLAHRPLSPPAVSPAKR